MRTERAAACYARLLRLYPQSFRVRFGEDLEATFRAWYARELSDHGSGARAWRRLLSDLASSVPREWWAVMEERRAVRRADPHAPAYGAALLAGLAVLLLYAATLAPSIAFWDSAEYTTVAHILGIPHPPGSPLFVLLANAWLRLLSPLDLPVAVSINLFAATLSAAGQVFWFLLVERVLARVIPSRPARLAAAAVAVLTSATAFTVWSQSNVNEKVYPIAWLTTALVSWLVLRWRDTGRGGARLVAIALVLGLSSTNHLMGVLALPALVAFVWLVDRRALLRGRTLALSGVAVTLALSVQLFLPIRAAQRPIIAEGDPACASTSGALVSIYSLGRAGCDALSSVLTREQYGKPSMLADPNDPSLPRGPELLAAQLVNYAQYFDWQWGRSLNGHDPLFGAGRALVTLAVLLLGLLGLRMHWRSDRRSAVYLGLLFATLSGGLVIYLNFRYGFSIARDRFPANAMHEVRERDYFFLIGFGVWGLWVGMGLAGLWLGAAERLRERLSRPRLVASPLLALAVVPLVLNWSWADRSDDWTARDWAYNVLMSVEPYGVLFTNGDNDTFPLWYLQEVEGIRQDVTVVVTSYLNLDWYARQIRDLSAPCRAGADPGRDPSRIVCQRPLDVAALPAPLVDVGVDPSAPAPGDSVIPLSDDEIARIARSWFVVDEPIALEAGRIRATIARGTPLQPSDTFIAAILKAAIDERPIHFMGASGAIAKLGLEEYTVRQGLTLRLSNGSPAIEHADSAVRLPGATDSGIGAWIDLARTDTLLSEVYVVRGRVLDADAPWTDPANASIPMQYAIAHFAAAQAYDMTSRSADATRHLERARWWAARPG